MARELATYMQSFNPTLLSDSWQGREIDYTPAATGVQTTITGVVNFDDDKVERFDDAIYDSESATLAISNDATTGIASVVLRDKVTINGDDYYVAARKKPGNNGIWDILLNRTIIEARGNRTRERR